MKKTILLITTVLLFTGCVQNEEINIKADDMLVEEDPITENIKTYSDENLNISFDYSSDWEIHSEVDSPVIISSPGDWVYVVIPGKSFEEYESSHEKEIQENYMSTKETSLTFGDKTYSAREYLQHGGTTYLFEIDGNYVNITSSGGFTEVQEVQNELEIIINSLLYL